MKFIRRLLLFILIILVVVGGIFYMNGKKLYDEKLSQVSLSDKVNSLKQSEDFVYLKDLPKQYINAVVAVEDHRYYNHGAIDPIALLRATFSNLKQKEFKEGGSTITQQTAKNLYFISEDDVVSRKSAEAILSFTLEKEFSKDEILELYVNTIYFGNGYYGIKEACNGYLNKEPKDMTLYECTMLAGIPNAPSVYAPTVNFELTKKRQKKVVSSMQEYGYLTSEEASSLKNEIENSTLEDLKK